MAHSYPTGSSTPECRARSRDSDWPLDGALAALGVNVPRSSQVSLGLQTMITLKTLHSVELTPREAQGGAGASGRLIS